MKLFSLFLALLISMTTLGQKEAWKEMNDFHEMVSKVLHPVEAGNLQPLKNNSEVLLDKARKWKGAAVPAVYQYPKLKLDLEKLVSDCNELDQAINSRKSDGKIKNLAMQTHMDFHAILSATENKTK